MTNSDEPTAASVRHARRVRMGWMESHLVLPIIVAVLLAVIWVATYALSDVERSSAQRDAIMLTREQLGTYEAQVLRALRELDHTLRLTRYAYEGGRGNPLSELKQRSLLPPDLLFTVTVADRDGAIIASTRRSVAGSLAAADYFQALEQGEEDTLAIGRPARGPTADRKLQFARRLSAPDGSFSGIVVVSVDAAFFVSGYDPHQLGVQGLLGLVGVDGVVRVRRTGDSLFSGDQTDRATLVRPTGEEEEDVPVTRGPSPWDGISRYTATRQLYGFPLAVVVGLGEREQLAPARGKVNRYREYAALGSALIIGLGGWLWRLSWQLSQSRRREAEAKVQHAQQMEYLAYHDALTTLPNRSLFSKLLGQLIAQAQRHGKLLAVAFLDLDQFKQINDTLGHEAGDQLLKEVARRLRSCIRASDIVARLGGDEFVVLLPELRDEQDAANVARKIIGAVARPVTLLGQEFRVTASIGISTYPFGGTDEQTLTKNADIAMYHAKEAGKNTFKFYSPDLSASSLERLALESSVRHALERGELTLQYQAKCEMLTGRITGMEALLRWEHPELGMLAPSRFLHIAEETGLSIPIGKWVLETACRQNIAWQKQGLPRMTIAVNLTARQFTADSLLEDVATALRTSGLAPELLELEVAEGVLVRDVGRALRILTQLKGLGVRIAVDEFGTGYTSLALLQSFPLDTIKIDRSCVDGLSEMRANESVTRAIMALGRALSLTVVAQGVETQDQVEFLRNHACDELQGFYFSTPLPPDQATHLIESVIPRCASLAS